MTAKIKGDIDFFPQGNTRVTNRSLYYEYQSLPWQNDIQSDRRFRIILASFLFLTISAGVIIPFLSISLPETPPKKRVKKDLTQLITEVEIKEKPKPKVIKEEPKPKIVKKPPKKIRKQPIKKNPPDKKSTPKPKVAKNSGLLKMASELNKLTDAVEIEKLNRRDLTKSISARSDNSENLLKTRANQSDTSSVDTNIALADLEQALHGKDSVTLSGVNDDIGGSGHGGGKQTSSSSRSFSGRSDNNIRSTMDKNKSAIYLTYNRALRKNPDLEGKFVVRLVIEPSGRVSSATIVHSDLNNQALERRLLAKIRSINFGAKNVSQTTIDYTLNFFPS